MTKMNWDRARRQVGYAKATDHADREDEADERYFEREAARENRHWAWRSDDRHQVRPTPARGPSRGNTTSSPPVKRVTSQVSTPARTKKKRSKAEKAADQLRLAHRLGLSPKDLELLKSRVAIAWRNLPDVGKVERRKYAVARLRITQNEWAHLSRALTSRVPTDDDFRAGLIGRGVIRSDLDLTRGQTASTSAVSSTPSTTRRRTSAAPTTSRPKPRRYSAGRAGKQLGSGFRVYAIEFGDVVHLDNDCHGMRGFRHTNQPDPAVIIVGLDHPLCRDRRPCKKCFHSQELQVRTERDLAKFHGSMQSKRTVLKQKRKTAPKQPKTKKGLTFAQMVIADKLQQDQIEAKQKGQSLERLREWRRAKGISTKATTAEKRERDERIKRQYKLSDAELKVVKRG